MKNLQWTPTHSHLQGVMKREIETLRELLANLHQEEILILKKETAYWNQLMEERRVLLDKLSNLRQSRLHAIESLQAAKGPQAGIPLEQLLPLNNSNSWEILSLQDQILTLLDRMSLQSSRNEMVTHLTHHQTASQPQRKNKISLATEPLDDYNDGDAV